MRTLPDRISSIEIDGRTVRRDGHGYLVDPQDWSDGVADFLAAEEGISLTESHREIFSYMRGFLDEHGIAPDARFVFRHIAAKHGISAAEAKKRLFELFPYGYVKQACKIAGMRQPRAWSTG